MTARRHTYRNNRRGIGASGGGASADPTPATILAGTTYRWLEVGRGETLTADSGAGASDAGSGGGDYVCDQLNDQSPGGYNVLATTSARPRKEDYGFRGQPCFAGDGVNDRFQSTGTSFATNVNGVNQPYAIWMVMQAFVPSLVTIPWSFGANAASPFMEFFYSVTNVPSIRKNAGANVDATGGTSDLAPHLVYIEVQGSTVTVEIDGVVVIGPAASFTNGSMTFTQDAIMCLWRNTLTNFAPMRWPCQVLMDGNPTAGQKAAMDEYMNQWMQPQTAALLAVTGDSHTDVDIGETTWITIARAAFPASVIIDNGVVGDTLVNMLSKDAASGLIYRYADSTYEATRVANVYANHYGANDIEGASSRTALQVAADQETWTAAILARQPTAALVACTLHKIQGLPGAKETERVAYNTDMRANFLAKGFTHLLDKDLIITETPPDLSVFEADGKHLNATGEAYLFTGRNGVDGMQQILASLGFT